MIAPFGKNTNAIRVGAVAAAAPLAAAPARTVLGSITSRNGNPSEAPMPFRKVRRGRCISAFLRGLNVTAVLRGLRSLLIRLAGHAERLALDDRQNECRKA